MICAGLNSMKVKSVKSLLNVPKWHCGSSRRMTQGYEFKSQDSVPDALLDT